MNRLTRATGRSPLSVSLALAATMVLAVGACSPSSGDGGTVAPPPSTSAPSVEPGSPDLTPGTPEPSNQPSGSPTASPSATPGAATTVVRAYFFLGSFTDNPGLAPVLREIPATQAVATAAMEALLAGPASAELAARPAMYTAIPAGTRLLGLRIDEGLATVNLSREFESGGGSASIFGRLAQLVYTLTQFPTVDRVALELDGTPVTVFSGEGLILDEPMTRADYRDDIVAEIAVDRPAWGAAAGNPIRVVGITRVFEATFQVEILDGAGAVVASETVMASCGTGCWGDFDVTIPYPVETPQWGTLRVFEYSARDGAPEHVTEYPVWLTPAS